jgi:RNA polymerase sigma factor (sigma-70 family)
MNGTDLELLARYLNAQDAEAFAQLAARHRDMVYGTCRRLLGSRPDAEDAAQECFLQLARSGASVRTSVAGWLHRVAVRSSLALQRKDRARKQAEREAGSMVTDPAAEATWEDIQADVDRAIDALPDQLREPLVLHFLQGKPQTAIAEQLGISQPAVSMRIKKGIERLRKHLSQTGLVLSAATLATLLSTQTAEAAPATLIASLGRMALVGAQPAGHATVAASVLGHAASIGPGTKIVCLLAASLAIGAAVQQTVRGRSVADEQPVIVQALAGAPTQSVGKGGPRQVAVHTKEVVEGRAVPPGTAQPSATPVSPQPPTRPSAATPDRPVRTAQADAPQVHASHGDAVERQPVSAPRPDRLTTSTPTRPPMSPAVPKADPPIRTVHTSVPGIRIAQAEQNPQAAADTTPEPQTHGASVSISPSGVVTIADGEGPLATLWLIAFGPGWQPGDQRQAAAGFPVAGNAGWIALTGEIPVPRTDGGRVLYEQRLRGTDTGIELEYDVGLSQPMPLDGVALTLQAVRERFAGEAVVLYAVDGQTQTVTLPEELAPPNFRLGGMRGTMVEIAPDPDPLLAISIIEPSAMPLAVQDERLFGIDEYAIRLNIHSGTASRPGVGAFGWQPGRPTQEVSPENRYSLKLWLDFPGMLPLGAVHLPGMVVRPGVRLCHDPQVEEDLCTAIADVVSAAKQTLEGLLPELARDEVRVCVLPATDWHESTATDRRDTILMRVSDHGFGELLRADAGPVGMLCQAVAELGNRQRVPGLDRFLTHRYLAPAVMDELGPDVIPGRHPTPLADDGPSMLAVIAGDAYTPVHPDFAAVKALVAIEDALGLDGFRELLRGLPPTTPDPFAALRQAAVEADPGLAGAFAAYDEALDIELEDDGKHLIASFEPDGIVKGVTAHPLRSILEDMVLLVSPQFEVSQSGDWSTHGTHSLRLHTSDPQPGMHATIVDPDWEFKDWRRFSRFEMDLMLVGERAQEVAIGLMDDVGGAHRDLPMFLGAVSPDAPVHIAYDIDPDGLHEQEQAQLADLTGPFRLDEVSCVYLRLPAPTWPVTLYIDNLRLTPRGGEKPELQADQPGAAAQETGRASVRAAVPVQRGPEVAEGLWRMFRGGPQRTGQGAGSGATGALAWQFDTGTDRFVTSPTTGPDGTLYVGSHDQNVYALDPATGGKRWAFPTGEKVTSTPAVGRDGTVYVGSWDWKVYALDGATGAKKWEFKTDGEVASSPAIAEDGTVYIGGGGTLYALNGATGVPIWATHQDSILFGSPALSADGRLVYAALCYHPNRGLYALNAKTGEREWWFRTEMDNTTTPAVGPDGTVYFGSADDRVYALDGATGEMKWEFITGRDAEDPAISPDGTIYVWSWDYRLYAIDGVTGEELGEFATRTDGGVWGVAAIGSDDTVYLGCEKIFALDKSLHPLWEFGDGDNALCAPTIGPDGTIYAGSSHGQVYAIR